MAYENITGTAALSQIKAPTVSDAVYAPDFKTNTIQPMANNIEKALSLVLVSCADMTAVSGLVGNGTSTTPSAVSNGNHSVDVLAGDTVEITFGPLNVKQSTSGTGTLDLVITEDATGSQTPVKHNAWNYPFSFGQQSLTTTVRYEVTKPGTLGFVLFASTDGSGSFGVLGSGNLTWGTIKVYGHAR